MDGKRAFTPFSRAAGAAARVIAGEHLLAQAAEVGAILALQRLAGRAETTGEDLCAATGAVKVAAAGADAS